MLYTHFFWDFDGTLYDTYARMTRALVKGMASLGIKTDFDTAYNRMKVSLRYASETYAAENPHLHITMEDGIRAYRVYSEEEGPETMQPYAGIPALLESVVKAGGKNYLYTHRGLGALDALERDGLKQYFTDFVTSKDGFPSKPAPDALNYLVNKHGLDLTTCIMLGDRSIDLDAGKNAGMQGGLFDPDRLYTTYAADYRFETVKDMYETLMEEKNHE